MQNRIELSNTEGCIWEIEKRIVDIIRVLETQGKCTIGLNSEGPCSESIGLYSLIDYVCERLDFDKNLITIHTMNQIESHANYRIKISPPLYVQEGQDFCREHAELISSIDKDFSRPIGIFIGRSTNFRLWLASQMKDRYGHKVALTYHYDRSFDFHRPHCGIEKMINQQLPDDVVKEAVDFLLQCPIKLSEDPISDQITTSQSIEMARHYNKFFCEIVCETYCIGKTFYPTEKIWRPLMMKTPFIVQGPMYYLDNLKRLGFETFDRWWDEGHQHDPHDYQPDVILKLTDRLMAMSEKELSDMYDDMRPVLEHNHQRFMELSDNDFADAFGYTL